MRSCLSGDQNSQRALYDKYAPVLYPICLRYCNNSENASDMLQESFIKVFDALHKFRFEGSFEGWLKRVTVNTCLDFNKKLKAEPYGEDLESYHGLGDAETVTGRLQAADLIKMLQKLPAGYRMVFNLYVMEGFSHQEVAGKMGISENTSKTQLFKARKMLQAWLAKET